MVSRSRHTVDAERSPSRQRTKSCANGHISSSGREFVATVLNLVEQMIERAVLLFHCSQLRFSSSPFKTESTAPLNSASDRSWPSWRFGTRTRNSKSCCVAYVYRALQIQQMQMELLEKSVKYAKVHLRKAISSRFGGCGGRCAEQPQSCCRAGGALLNPMPVIAQHFVADGERSGSCRARLPG